MQKQLSLVGWRAEFFPAIKPKCAAGFPSIGARGCFLSHLAVLKSAYDVHAQRLIIIEDDVNFAADFVERWKIAMSELQTRSWSIFYPGHTFDTLPPGLSVVSPNTGVRCTHFMVINRDAIPRLIAGLEQILSRVPGDPSGGPMHVDGAYSTIRNKDLSLTTYAYCPTLAYQRPSRTDVGDLQWFDRVGMLTPIVNVARRLKAARD